MSDSKPKTSLNYTRQSPPFKGRLKNSRNVAALQFDLNLFDHSNPVVRLEPVPNRAGRVRLIVTQLDCRWELIPSLNVAEAKALLEFAAAEGIAFDLDLNQGWPIESERLHWATELVIGLEVGA